jgi:hypothetical protein
MPAQSVSRGKAQRQIAGRFIEIGAKTAACKAGRFGADAGKGLDHQILRVLRVADDGVYVQRHAVAVALHELG